MNERIRELADQCRTEYRDGHGGFTEQFDEEKFAELIVRECAEQIISKGTDWVDFAPSQTGVRPEYWDMAQQIKEHFGVEVECNQEEQEKFAPKHKCSVCGTTENVRWMGGYQPYLCDSVDCIPF